MPRVDATLTAATDRRTFLLSAGILAAGSSTPAALGAPQQQDSTTKPPADDDAATPENGRVTLRTLIEAEKLAGVRYTPAERQQLLKSIEGHIELLSARAASFMPSNDMAPASVFDPRLSGFSLPFDETTVSFNDIAPSPLPGDEDDIAFASVMQLGAWLRAGAITSQRLTSIYLRRLREHGPKLECVITLMEEQAMQQAARADAELAQGHVRSPVHGIPWGAKDLLDTAGVPTTWGAAPYRNRVPESDAVVVQRLDDAGAVLAAKLTLGALAYGDIWFDGRTNNPWNFEQGSSGSSAGSAAAVVAGLVGFAIGTETYGSIVSPSMRCGATGLRPTFGRVARTGAMALCWSLDKIGPICRTVEDCMAVLSVINGSDGGDPSSIDAPLHYEASRPVRGLRMGYDPAWFEGDDIHPADSEALNLLRTMGVETVPIERPAMNVDPLLVILLAEAAAAFEQLTLGDLDDQLVWQDVDAWPNSFRQARFIPAIELVQVDRLRRQVMAAMDSAFADIDAMISPSFAGDMLLVTNYTGHPSLTIRSGFNSDGTPHGITLWGRLFEEGTLCNLGAALEREFDVWRARPMMD